MGVDTLSIHKVIGSFDLRENIRVKFKTKLAGGPSLPGVGKFQKLLRWIDRESPDLFNGEKILGLRRT